MSQPYFIRLFCYDSDCLTQPEPRVIYINTSDISTIHVSMRQDVKGNVNTPLYAEIRMNGMSTIDSIRIKDRSCILELLRSLKVLKNYGDSDAEKDKEIYNEHLEMYRENTE